MLSIIVPVYNVESYLKQCVESILNQSYEDFELILVDDGSTDKCPQICDEYALQDSRVKVIHKPNGGAVSACNKGLEASTGEYICFIDADDFIAEDYLSTLFSALKEDTDMVCMNCIRFWNDDENNLFKINSLPAGEYTVDESILQRAINDNGSYKKIIANCRWAKLIKADIVKKYARHCSDKVTFGEDFQLILGVILGCKKIVVIDEYKYYYRFNNSSVVNTYKKDLWARTNILFDAIKAIPEITGIDNFEAQFNTEFLLYINSCIKNEYFYKKLSKDCFNKIVCDERTQAALKNYQDADTGRLDKKMIKAMQGKSLRRMKNVLNVYSIYCKLRGLDR